MYLKNLNFLNFWVGYSLKCLFIRCEAFWELKYFEGKPAIKEIKRSSKPGLRLYSSMKDMPLNYGGLGISIVSTSKGLMSDHEARSANIGGEILCSVF